MLNLKKLSGLDYIGDSVYVGRDELGRVWLATSNSGELVTNEICLEPEVLREFQRWLTLD